MIRRRDAHFATIFLFVLLFVVGGCVPSEPTSPTPITAVTITNPPPSPTIASPPTETPQPSPTSEPLPQPSPSVTPMETEEATAVPQPSPAAQPIPVEENLTFTVQTQLGGTMNSILVVDNVAFVGVGARILAVDVTDGSNAVELAQTALMNGTVLDMTLDDASGMLLVALNSGGLAVVNPTPTSGELPILSEGPSYGGSKLLNAQTVLVHEGVAFVLDGGRYDQSSELVRFDLSDISQPMMLDTISLPERSRISQWDAFIFVEHDQGISFLDSDDPTVELATIPLPSGVYQPRIVVRGESAFVTTNGNPFSLRIFDVSEPLTPQEVTIASGHPELFNITLTAVNQTHLAISSNYGEQGYCQSMVGIYNVSDAANPQENAPFDPLNCLNDLALDDDGRLYLVGLSGLMIYDIGDGSSPVQLTHFSTPGGLMNAQAVAQNGNFMYVLSGNGRGNRISTIDISSGEAMVVGTPVELEGIFPLDLFVRGDRLILTNWNSGFLLFDISDPLQPSFLYEAKGDSGEYSAELFTTAVFDTFLVMRSYDESLIGGLALVDFSDPTTPTIIDTIETGIHQIDAVIRHGEMLFTLSSEGQATLHAFDLSNPNEPLLAATLSLHEQYSRLTLLGNTLYAYCQMYACDALLPIDISDPVNPQPEPERYSMPIDINHMVALDDERLLAMTSGDGMWVMGVRDAGLVLNGRIHTPSNAYFAQSNRDGTVVVPSGDGVYLIRIE